MILGSQIEQGNWGMSIVMICKDKCYIGMRKCNGHQTIHQIQINLLPSHTGNISGTQLM